MKTIILSTFLLVSSYVFSQYQPLLYTWGDYHGAYSVPNIEESGDNFRILKIQTVSLDMLKIRKRTGLAKLLSSKRLYSCNEAEIYEISKDGKKTIKRESYWMLPGNETLNPNNESHKFYSEGEISKMYPNLFITKAKVKFGLENNRMVTYNFDTYYQNYFVSTRDLIKCKHPTRTDKYASRTIYGNIVYDEKSNKIIAAYLGEKNKEDKYAYMKNYEVIIIDPSCKIFTQKKLQFDYPRVFKEQMPVYDINDSRKIIGHLLFFERQNTGKKTSDPDKTNIRIVYCPNEGNVISTLVKFRTKNFGWERIHGIFGDRENIYMSYHSYCKDGSFIGIKKINKIGESEDFKYSEEQLTKNHAIPTGNTGELNRSRKIMGALNEDPGFSWNGPDFKMNGVQKTDTKLYIWGQTVYSVPDPNYKGDGFAPDIKYYAEGYVFVYNNKDMSFEKAFMINIPCNKTESTFNLIAKEGDAVEFFIPIESKEHHDYSKTIVKKNLNSKERYGNDYSRLMSPLFMTINGSEGKFEYYEDVYTLNLEQGLINCKDGSRYIVGFEAYAGKSRDDAGVPAYRNKHYFYFIKLKY